MAGFGRPLTTVSNMLGHNRHLNYQHDRDGNRTVLSFASDNSSFRFDHDGLGRTIWVIDNPALTHVDNYVMRYFYKPDGSRHAALRGIGPAGFASVYHRDPVQRLSILVNDLAGTASDMSVSLAYNPAGQIRFYHRDNDAYAWTGGTSINRDYTVNGQNQYTSTTTATLAYDDNGNLRSDGTTTYTYDVENRLVSAQGEKTADLVYDPLGRLAQVSGGPAGVTQFLYDGDKLVAEYNASGALTKRYAHGPGTDEPIAVYEGPALGTANRRYMLPDERGSIVALVNADGTRSATNSYDEYGVPGAEPVGRFGYTGQTWIPELGLWYYKARFYSSRLGRFLQTDPIGYEDQVNLYAYVGNDPINSTDPDGKKACPRGSGVCGFIRDFFIGDIEDAVANPSPKTIAVAVVMTVVKPAKIADKIVDGVDAVRKANRAGRQARLRALGSDPKVGRADRGWIRQEQNSISRGQRNHIRTPPGKTLAHERGREAAKGYSYEHSNLQNVNLHKTQHKLDDFGRRNKERPPE